LFKNCLIISLICFSGTTAYTQIANESPASGYFAMNNFSNQEPTALATAFNPAVLARIKNTTAGIFGEKRFLLNELAFYRFAMALHTKPGNFGVNGYYSGSVNFNSISIGGSYGRQLGDKADVGIQFDYSSYQLKGYGRASYINVQLGSIFHLNEYLNAGIHVKNLAGFRSNKNSEPLNPVFTVGLGYDASENFYAAISFQKEVDHPNDISAMIRYKLQENISFKGGISTLIPVAYGGVSFGIKDFTIDLLSSYHPQLGITPGLALQYNFEQKQE
jgi:hypothetical protein